MGYSNKVPKNVKNIKKNTLKIIKIKKLINCEAELIKKVNEKSDKQ